MREVELSTPISEKAARNLRAGDVVYLTGKKIFVIPFTVSAEPVLESIDKGKPLFDLPGSVIYHTPFGFREEDGEWKFRSRKLQLSWLVPLDRGWAEPEEAPR